MYVYDAPIRLAGNSAARKLQVQVVRAHHMFTAYASRLTDPYGKNSAAIAKAAFLAITQGDFRSVALAEAEAEVLAYWPKPTNLNVTEHGVKNWFNWFKTADIFGGIRGRGVADDFGLGLGCFTPCGHCFEGNGSREVKHSPLFVAVRKMQVDYNSIAWPSFDVPRRINVMDWYDPLFGFSFDALVSFAFNVSSNGTRPRISLLTKGWDQNDSRAQTSVENFVRLVLTLHDTDINVSFNLALSHPELDFIAALFRQQTGQDKHAIDKVVANYGRRYGNVFNTLSVIINRIGVYDRLESSIRLPSSYRDHLPREIFLTATREALRQAFAETSGIRQITLLSNVDDDVGRRIFTRGRGGDFLYRLALANQRDERCLQSNCTRITDDLVPDPGYPVVTTSSDRQIKVYDHSEQVFQSNYDLLPPAEYRMF